MADDVPPAWEEIEPDYTFQEKLWLNVEEDEAIVVERDKWPSRDTFTTLLLPGNYRADPTPKDELISSAPERSAAIEMATSFMQKRASASE